MSVKPIPDGYHSITPYLIVENGPKALEFYANAFGAVERMRMPGPQGKIMHAELEIGGSVLMLADEFPEMGAKSPKAFGGSPISILLYVENVDEQFAQAVNAGATILHPLDTKFYGDRSGTIQDPFGHKWTIASHVEDMSPEELARRMESSKCGEKS
jgi:PhnB protein